MINIVIGIAVGAAFAPFWMKVWETVKAKYKEFTEKK
jgi:hypothetical protein